MKNCLVVIWILIWYRNRFALYTFPNISFLNRNGQYLKNISIIYIIFSNLRLQCRPFHINVTVQCPQKSRHVQLQGFRFPRGFRHAWRSPHRASARAQWWCPQAALSRIVWCNFVCFLNRVKQFFVLSHRFRHHRSRHSFCFSPYSTWRSLCSEIIHFLKIYTFWKNKPLVCVI